MTRRTRAYGLVTVHSSTKYILIVTELTIRL